MSGKQTKPIALITGATSGFGLEFCKIFARDGYDLVLTARHEEDLKKTASDLKQIYPDLTTHHVALDLATDAGPTKLFDYTQAHSLQVEVLVNNAGIGVHGAFAENTAAREDELVHLNVNALTMLCHLYLPGMIQRRHGKILNIASLAGFQAGPLYATYFASKAYVVTFSEALTLENKDKGITVTALCPPPSRTNFFKRAGMAETSRVLRMSMHNPAPIAKAGYLGLKKGKAVVLPSARSRFIALGYHIFPRAIVARIAKRSIESASRG